MSRKLISVVSVLEEKHKAQIRAAAEMNGFEALFFDGPGQARPFLAEAEIVFGHDAELAHITPRLRWLCTPFAGVDQLIGQTVFTSAQAVLTNSSGAYGVTISEHVVLMILEVLRRQAEYGALLRRKEWKRDLPVRSIRGSRITLLGTGDIGKESAKRLRAFDPASLTGVNRSGKNPGSLFGRVFAQDEMETALSGTDILVAALPGTPQTHRLLNARRLSLLPDQALVVNVGRGSAVDQKALEKELRKGRLFAALDVFEQEPIPRDDPIWDCPNLLMTPHVAGNMMLPYTKDRIVSLFLEDFENYCAGRPLKRRVDPARGY
ncbi:MAG: D-2-hydroxyacid dehydrogenase [Clostridia bacterium]|nr:D-2-hydroxyacid dehydrogenase [Clostridia bacterium]